MSLPEFTLPFKLNPQDLLFVDIECGYRYGAGSEHWESLRISPSLGVVLTKRESEKDKPEEVKGKIAPEALIPLLMILEAEGFFELPDDDTDDENGPVRSMTLSLPARKKRIVMTGIRFRELDYLAGAMKLTAGLSVVEALGKGFLKSL